MADLFLQRGMPYRFRWMGSDRIPGELDLRTRGWLLDLGEGALIDAIGIMPVDRQDQTGWDAMIAMPRDVRRFVIVIGSLTGDERTDLLRQGFGDAFTGTLIDGGEFELRASRLAEMARWLPRHRRLGDLELDLLTREAYGCGKPLNLNPREFALIWRLADTPGEPVSKQDLIQDVWRMGFVPETNSIAVHMSRLRRKLSFVNLAGMIATAPAGGYCLVTDMERTRSAPTGFLHSRAPSLSLQVIA